jgi:Domain of unknown function (DUF1839)
MHPVHGDDRVWPETNCYTDLLIELVHALGHEPLAMLGFTLAIDFDLDQWTFFKPPASDLYRLYGIDLQELAIWRPLAAHLEEHVGAGRPVLVEVDSYYLPDTAGTAYRRAHVKTTIGVDAIDAAAEQLGYFHNRGHYALEGDDFRGILQDRGLPPYAEFIKVNGSQGDLRQAKALAGEHLARAPHCNPFPRFKQRLQRDLEWLAASDIEQFHTYSFATFRQFGSCYELAAAHLQWLGGLGGAAKLLGDIAAETKAAQFQLARAMARRRALDLSPVDGMAERWEGAFAELRRLL